MRLIDADELKKAFEDTVCIEPIPFAFVKQIIDNAPTVKERPTGEWKLDDTEQFCYCSNCEDTYYPRPLEPSWDYCPHCGARMEEETE